jgi:hypothetical protein
MVDVTEGLPVQQTHNGNGPQIDGNGPQIAGHNFGAIKYELLDGKTKSTLAKLSKDAPELASILKTAIRDGVISPDTVAALQSAVRHINEDVAQQLWYAARNINEDVAQQLYYAARNINEDVASDFVRVNHGIGDTGRDLDRILSSLQDTARELRSLQGGINPGRYEPAETAAFVAAPSSRTRDTWGFRFKLFCSGCGLGLLGAALLISHRLGGWAVFAGAIALAIPVASWIAKTYR